MQTNIKNIIVLLLVFAAAALLFFGSNSFEKIGEVRVDAGPINASHGEMKSSLPETTVQPVEDGQKTAESAEVHFAADLEEGPVGEPSSQQSEAVDHLALGMEFYKKDDLQNALTHLQEVLRIDPDNSAAKGLVSKISREARVEGSFINKEGSHFNVRYEGGESDVVGHLVAIILEEAYQKIGSDLGFYPDHSITTILYSAEQFRDVTRAPSWSGAIYDGKIRIPVGGVRERSDVLEKVIFHEYTHAVVHRMGGGKVPTWLNEGIAQYEEGQLSEREDGFRYLATSLSLVPLSYLEGSFMGLTQEQAVIAYTEGLSAVKYIMDEYGVGMLSRLISSYKDGKGSEAAIKDTFQMTYKEFQESWIRSLKKRYG
ncbi:MAG: peptidase MA family metallohydrolase [Deltaproteobacteria bacterium]|nr:peptidase MA family metallohydrolase [Deltaproteobacteria bacterium]